MNFKHTFRCFFAIWNALLKKIYSEQIIQYVKALSINYLIGYFVEKRVIFDGG